MKTLPPSPPCTLLFWWLVVACQRWQYKTMVTAMDRSIGLLLDAIRDLGVENNTLVVFTSGE